jgi:2-oxoisovalerate dehydrogenase E2 component (dihydrolipoyl transacylase)
VAEREFKLPDLGEGLTDGEVVRWLVAEGDAIELNQPIVEVETAKAVVEIPAPYGGTVVKLHAAEGESLDVGAPLISVDTAGGASAPAAAQAAPAVAAEPDPTQELQATLVGPGERQQVRRRRIGGHARSANGPATTTPGPAGQCPRATPPVRRYAKDRGVDLAALVGTGRDGRITREDVDGALDGAQDGARVGAQDGARVGARPAAAVAPARQPRDRGEERIPVRGTRRQIAAAMTASAFSIPHVTEFLTVDATRLMELRERLRALPAADGLKLTPLAVVARALCAAVRSYPLMNSSWDEAAGDIVVKGRVNLGIATDTPTGLLVPNIKDADTLGILDLSRELTRLTELARERKATPSDLTGGTITITNVGGFGVETGTPIINKPECAILATGLIAPRPWVVDGQLAVRQLMTTSVSFDHRIVDGAYAAQFLAHLRDLLEDPALLSAF